MKTLISTVLAIGLSFASFAEPMLITGQISSIEQHIVTAPRSDRWNIQIQWLLEEGAMAQEGDLIAVFDSGNIQSQIQQTKESLAAEKLKLKQQEVKLKQAVVEAQGKLDIAKLEVEKAGIEASISSIEVSEYDKGQYRLTLERAVFTQIQAEQDLKVKQSEYRSGIEKQKIEITKLEEALAHHEVMLERVSVKSKVTGLVSHAYHPWNGEKITAGITVQQAMKVMSVEGQDNYQVLAWVHEVDVNKIAVGDMAKLTLDAFSSEPYQGKISSVASQSEKKAGWSTSAYHLVKIDFINQPEQTLLPGMSVRVVIDKEVL